MTGRRTRRGLERVSRRLPGRRCRAGCAPLEQTAVRPNVRFP
ncbi:hypothetical protein SFR_1661 [Streptomyces sp. FR-008]|nr:hypothetical protein SFR_1661 [Streptomyces sp. FR-008]